MGGLKPLRKDGPLMIGTAAEHIVRDRSFSARQAQGLPETDPVARDVTHALLRLHSPLLVDPVNDLPLRHIPTYHFTKQLPHLRVVIAFHRLEQFCQPVL